MQRFLVKLLATALAGVFLSRGTPAADNLVVNGSFELGADPGMFKDLPGGSTAITGWTVGGFHVDYTASATWNASDGVRSVDLDGSVFSPPKDGSIFQSFATTAGQTYRVTFDLSGNNVGLPLLKQVEVSAGNSVQTFTHDIGAVVTFVPPLAIDYQHETFLFTATASTTTLTFKSLTPLSGSPPGYGPVIDNVLVEPTTWTDLGFALAGVSGAPQLEGSGLLTTGSDGSIVLSDAAPSAPALLFISLASSPVPFKGGTLVPVPTLTALALVTSPGGTVPLLWINWPAGLSGNSLYFQYGIKDTAAIHDVALSNALRADVP